MEPTHESDQTYNKFIYKISTLTHLGKASTEHLIMFLLDKLLQNRKRGPPNAL